MLREERHEKSDEGSDLSLQPISQEILGLLEGNIRRQNTMLLCIFKNIPIHHSHKDIPKQPRPGILGNRSKFRMLNFGIQVRFRDEGLQSDARALSYLI